MNLTIQDMIDSGKKYSDMRRNLVWFEKNRSSIFYRAAYVNDPLARAVQKAKSTLLIHTSINDVNAWNAACEAYRNAHENA